MSGPFDDFIKQCAEDCVNGSSGVSAYAAGLREAAHDVAEERGPWLGVEYRCPECGRRVLSLQHDGRCDQCVKPTEEEAELARREAPQRYLAVARTWIEQGHRDQAADLLLLVVRDENVAPEFRAALLEEVELLKRRAS